MEFEIYVDVLFFINFFIDVMILSVCYYILSFNVKSYRIVFAGFYGGLYSVFAFLVNQNFIISFLLNVISLGLMVFIAFGKRNLINLLKGAGIFLLISLLFGGCIFFLYLFTGLGRKITVLNGAYYFDISFLTLILFALFSSFVSILFFRLNKLKFIHSKIYQIYISVGGKRTVLNGFMDSGNNLTDLISGAPVIIAEYDKIKNILPPPLQKRDLYSGKMGDLMDIIGKDDKNRVKIIMYNGIWNSTNHMVCIKPDYIKLTENKRTVFVEKVYIGITLTKLSAAGSYEMLLNPEIL